MKQLSLKEELQNNAYPGRGIVIGKSANGRYAVTAYFIMGRSTDVYKRQEQDITGIPDLREIRGSDIAEEQEGKRHLEVEGVQGLYEGGIQKVDLLQDVAKDHKQKNRDSCIQTEDVYKRQQFGQLMNASHVSLRDDYEVTGIELDTLVEEAWKVPGVIGSRMTGAGFGGCTVSIVEDDAIDTFKKQVGDAYLAKIGYAADFYVVEIGDGPVVL